MREGTKSLDALERITAIAEIRKLKATYWVCADTGNWDGLVACMTDDMAWDSRYERRFAKGLPMEALPSTEEAIAAGDPGVVVGANASVGFMRANNSTFINFHQGGAPIIEVDSEDEARAIWPFFDHLKRDGGVFRGYGHYHERYRREGGRWLICQTQMRRTYHDPEYGPYPIRLANETD